MSKLGFNKSKERYDVLDRDCLGRECLQLGHFQTRGATLSGSRNTGDSKPCCMRRAYHGCPTPLPPPTHDLIDQRKAEGLKVYP
jgi:hypothetical protein